MIPSTFDPLYFKTVLPTYSWDQGTPGVSLDSTLYRTGFLANSAASNNANKIEYVGYAPFVYVSLSSFPGGIDNSQQFLALERTVDFGDYYNSENNLVTVPGLSNANFCHVYVMPGLYTITYTRTEHIRYEYFNIDGLGNCLQRHCIDWSYSSLSSTVPRKDQITWANTGLYDTYEKQWAFEECGATYQQMAGIYIEPANKAINHPLSWQWYNFLQDPRSIRNEPITWLSSGFQSSNQFTWRDSNGPCVSLPVEGVTWRWDNIKKLELSATAVQKLLVKDVTWDEVKSDYPGNVTWDFVKNQNCSIIGTIALSSIVETKTLSATIRVKEIAPTAYLDLEQPEDRLSPLTVRLSPKNTICGSFPIEKIIWDLGDGSPLLEQRRWSNTLEKPFVYSGAVGNDYEDPRNYDVIHTYVRSANSPSTFYASLTAYAANTNTSDSVSIMVGPLKYKNTTGSNFRLLQNELTDQGKALIGQIDDTNVSLWKIDTIFKEIVTIAHPYFYFGYYSEDRPLVNGKSKLYTKIYSNAAPVVSLSGLYPIENFPNLDAWQTDEDGVVSWSLHVVHPVSFNNFIDLDSLPFFGSTFVQPYLSSDDYYVDTVQLTSGVSKLYESRGTAAAIVAAIAGGDGVDLDDDGRLDTFSTNLSGVITWAPTIYNTAYYPGLSGYTRTQILTSGVSKLYDGPYSDAALVVFEGGLAKFNGEENQQQWSTDSQGIITWQEKIVHPYAVGNPVIGYVDILNFESGTQILWNGRGSAAEPVVTSTATELLTSYIDGNLDVDQYIIDENGIVFWFMYQAHAYTFGVGNLEESYYVDIGQDSQGDDVDTEQFYNSQILWSKPGSSATKILTASGQVELLFEPAITDFYSWQTDGDGRLTVSLLTAHPFLQLGEYYSDVEILSSKNIEAGILEGSPLWYNKGALADRVLNETGIGDADKDGNDDNWTISPIGHLTFSMISAYPFKQFYGFTAEPVLSSGISVLRNGQGTGATFVAVSAGAFDIDGDGNLDSWTVDENGILRWEMIVLYPWEQFYGYSATKEVISGVTSIWSGRGTGARPLSGESGVNDVDQQGDLDEWSTDNNGVVTWSQINPHPWSQLGSFYSDLSSIVNNETVLWDSPGTGADLVSNQNGIYDIDGDGNDEQWSTNSAGFVSWYTISAHPYAKFSYYTDTNILTSGTSKLWRGFGTGAVVAASEYSQLETDYVDIDGDGNLDEWDTDEDGVLSFQILKVHQVSFLGTNYFADTEQFVNGETKIWTGRGSGATAATLITGTYVDIDGDEDGIEDTWTTNLSGIVSWNKTIYYPFQFPGLSGFTATNYVSSGSTILWSTQYSNAAIVSNDSGTYTDLRGDQYTWSTNENGLVTSALVSAHPYKQTLLGDYYSNESSLVNGTTILWSSQGTGASAVSLASGQAKINEDLDTDLWTTDTNGLLTWATLSAYPYKQFYGYSETPEVLSFRATRLWTKPGDTAVPVALSSGTADVNGDGNLDAWDVDFLGFAAWYTLSAHPYRQVFGKFTDNPVLTSGISQIWNGFGTGATLLTSYIQTSNFVDIDGDGNVDVYSTNANGVISWYMLSAYPFRCLNGQYYAATDILVSGQSKVYLQPGSGSSYLTNLSDNTNTIDINNDGDLGSYSIDQNGIITYTLLTAHPYQVVKDIGGTGEVLYYADEPTLTQTSTQIYTKFGTGGTLAVNVTGVDLIDGDPNRDVWITDSTGRISWFMLSAYPYKQFYGYSATPNLINNFTQLYQEKGTAALFVNVSAGFLDLDGDSNLDLWRVSTAGVISWMMVSAYPYAQFAGTISAADVSVVTTPVSVAGNPTIPGTNFTYNLTFVPDTYNSNGITHAAFISSNPLIPWNPQQTYQLVSAADVMPVIINGVVQTTPLSVAGNPTIPGTEFTYRFVNRLDGYTATEQVESGTTVLYNSPGTSARPVTAASGGGFIGVNEINWTTDSSGILTVNLVSAHPYFHFDTFTLGQPRSIHTDTVEMLSGVSIAWNGFGTGSIPIRDLRGIDDIDGDGTLEEWYTNSQGVIFYELTKTFGKYFYAISDFSWFTQSNWYIRENRSLKANNLPLSTFDVVILSGSNRAYAVIDDTRWVQPSSIDATRAGVEFFATVPTAVTCNVSGSTGFPVRFSGNATYQAFGDSPIRGRFWKSSYHTDWYQLTSWFYDRTGNYEATLLPSAKTRVEILNEGSAPFVDLDNVNWLQPLSIDATDMGVAGITFYSLQSNYVNCPLYGSVYFQGNARYGSEPLVGVFWYSNDSVSWFDVNNWYVNRSKTIQGDVRPVASSKVTILAANSSPVVNIKNQLWVQPESIDARENRITFTSDTVKEVTCIIQGKVGFEGSAVYGIPISNNTLFWYSNGNQDWFDQANWYTNSNASRSASRIPRAGDHVVILDSPQTPIVDLDDLLWVEPNSIDVRRSTIRFMSDSQREINCTIYGNPIFTIKARYGDDPNN